MNNWYDLPKYYDISFSHDMQDELVFLREIFSRLAPVNRCRLLEPACGTGRLLVPLSRAGFKCTGFDLNPHALRYLQKKLHKKDLSARVFQADMDSFAVAEEHFHAAFCTVDTFRHLLSGHAAVTHLRNVAAALRPGGIYVLGLHLVTDKSYGQQVVRWSVTRGRLTLKTSMHMIQFDERKRRETLKVELKPLLSGNRKKKHTSVYDLRTYTLRQLHKLIETSGVFEIIDAYDEYYDLNRCIKLNASTEYAVLILRKCA